MVLTKVNKLKFLELIFIFSGTLAMLWFSIIKAYKEFTSIEFIVFLVGLFITVGFVVYILKKELTTFWSKY